MMRKSFFLLMLGTLLTLLPSDCKAQLTINIRYSAENGNAKKYVEEMEKSGIADKIRNIEGCLRYDFFSQQMIQRGCF